MISGMHPAWKLMGPDPSEMIPIVHDLVPTVENFCKLGGLKHIDALTWHWYPWESKRCPLSGFPDHVTPERLASVTGMDKDDKLEEKFIGLLGDSGKEIWMGETAGADCGGEVNSTDAWASSMWWMDALA